MDPKCPSYSSKTPIFIYSHRQFQEAKSLEVGRFEKEKPTIFPKCAGGSNATSRFAKTSPKSLALALTCRP